MSESKKSDRKPKSYSSTMSVDDIVQRISHRSSKISNSTYRKSLFPGSTTIKEEVTQTPYQRMRSDLTAPEPKTFFKANTKSMKKASSKRKQSIKLTYFQRFLKRVGSDFFTRKRERHKEIYSDMTDSNGNEDKKNSKVIPPPPEYSGCEKLLKEVFKESEKIGTNFEKYYGPYNAGVHFDKYMSFKHSKCNLEQDTTFMTLQKCPLKRLMQMLGVENQNDPRQNRMLNQDTWGRRQNKNTIRNIKTGSGIGRLGSARKKTINKSLKIVTSIKGVNYKNRYYGTRERKRSRFGKGKTDLKASQSKIEEEEQEIAISEKSSQHNFSKRKPNKHISHLPIPKNSLLPKVHITSPSYLSPTPHSKHPLSHPRKPTIPNPKPITLLNPIPKNPPQNRLKSLNSPNKIFFSNFPPKNPTQKYSKKFNKSPKKIMGKRCQFREVKSPKVHNLTKKGHLSENFGTIRPNHRRCFSAGPKRPTQKCLYKTMKQRDELRIKRKLRVYKKIVKDITMETIGM
ncbi:unnamed protein product [Moneuplotes crassus]|uniref:Uncharacterized protein n=1 Tax=Euplotes crassus TaxID=5936 RepID=A0AAD1TZV5_EUPCR|nr:unnamed protein product [Moneuplotes crassus]